MKVLFIIDSLTIGGAERVVVNLAKQLKKTGYETAILILRNVNFFKDELKNIPVFSVNKKEKFDLSVAFRIKKIINKFKPDIINTHLFTASFWTKIAILFNKIPLFEVHHNVLWEEKWYTSFHKLMNKLTNFKVTKHIFVSKDVQEFYKKVENIEGEIIYNGIEIEKFPFNSHRNKYELLFVGRLIERKGIRDLLSIEKKLDSKYHLTICGIGQMKEFVLKNKKKNTTFLEGCNSVEVFKNGGILLMPSYWEGFSMVILEALASGIPIISYNIKGNINNPLKHYLTLVERGNIKKFVNILLNYNYDYDIINKAREEVEKKYTAKKMAENYLRMFKKYVD